MLKVLIISKSFITKESLSIYFEGKFKDADINVVSKISELKKGLGEEDFIFIEIDNRSFEDIDNICNLKRKNNHIKVIVLDLESNQHQFIKCVKCNIDAYITHLYDKYDLDYIIKAILSGNKFYDSNITQFTIINSEKRMGELTKRECEVMSYVSDGFSNREIADILQITEYTVKKHISQILAKLNLRNRKDIKRYQNKKYLKGDKYE